MAKTGIREVAAAAGVSIGTVSRAFSTDPAFASRILPETKQRIYDAAQKLDYKPNYGARLLRGRRSGTVGVATSLPGEKRGWCFSPYIGRLLEGIGDRAAQAGYQLLLLLHGEDYRSYMHIQRIDALIVVGFRNETNRRQREMEAMFRSFQERKYPFIIINNNEAEELAFAHVTVDNREAMRQIGELILRKGYSDVGFVGELTPNPQRQLVARKQLLCEFLTAAGVPFDPECMINGVHPHLPEVPHTGPYHYLEGEAALRWMASRGKLPRCLVCGNDSLAQGVLQTCLAMGIRVPEELAVIGFDDNPESRLYLPALTTVHQPLEQFGSMAMEYVLRAMEDPDEPWPGLIRPRLMEREST